MSKRPIRPKIYTQLQTTTNNEFWFSDNPPDLGEGFSSADANKRSTTVIEILLRAAKRAAKDDHPELAKAYYQVLDKLDDRFHESCHKRGIHLGFRSPI